MFTNYDKAGGAVIGAALGTVIAYFYPMPAEMQGAVTLVLSGFLSWLLPNKGA